MNDLAIAPLGRLAAPATARAAAIRDAARRALAGPLPAEDLRAFAVHDMTCIVRWQRLEGNGSWRVTFRLRCGERSNEQELELPRLDGLATACEQRLRLFDQGRPQAGDQGRPQAAGSGRPQAAGSGRPQAGDWPRRRFGPR